LKKKRAKNFYYFWAAHLKTAKHQTHKSFLVLFFKKELLSS